MASQYDASDFVDGDFQAAHQNPYGVSSTPEPSGGSSQRPPSRAEVDAKVGEMQARQAELKRAQEELERQRAGLEELRRRQIEYSTGREEMVRNLTRALGLIEESEFAARRDAEQMARSLGDLRDALDKVQALNDQTWTKDTLNVELTRALTTIENARMEWNAARLKFPVLSPEPESQAGADAKAGAAAPLANQGFLQLCKIGLAMTWPLVLLGGITVLILLLRN